MQGSAPTIQAGGFISTAAMLASPTVDLQPTCVCGLVCAL